MKTKALEDEVIEELPDTNIDEDFLVDICTCGKCRECINHEISQQEVIECECVYEKEIAQIPSIDEDGNKIEIDVEVDVLIAQCERCKEIDRLKEILNKYNVFEKAYIDESLWDTYILHDGMIFENQQALDNYLNPPDVVPSVEDRVVDLEEQNTIQDGLIVTTMMAAAEVNEQLSNTDIMTTVSLEALAELNEQIILLQEEIKLLKGDGK